jgi:hypothetical protein
VAAAEAAQATIAQWAAGQADEAAAEAAEAAAQGAEARAQAAVRRGTGTGTGTNATEPAAAAAAAAAGNFTGGITPLAGDARPFSGGTPVPAGACFPCERGRFRREARQAEPDSVEIQHFGAHTENLARALADH